MREIVGEKKGSLVIFEISPGHKRYAAYCECGNLVEDIQPGKWKHKSMMLSCGCNARARHKDICLGEKIGYWTVIGFSAEPRARKNIFVECRCGHRQHLTSYEFRRADESNCCRGCYLRTVSGLDKMQSTARKSIFYRYQAKARRGSLDFSLSLDELTHIIGLRCHYCNRLPNNRFRDDRSSRIILEYSGIDRVDNTIGYVSENCVPCCVICNKAKRDLTYKEFIEWVGELAINLSLKGVI